MNFLKNRTAIGVIHTLLALITCLAVTPPSDEAISERMGIVRVVKPIETGERIITDKVSVVKVGGYNLPKDVVQNLDTAVGEFTSTGLAMEDYIISSRAVEEPAAESACPYDLTGERQTISVSLRVFASRLSRRPQNGDVVPAIVPGYKKQGSTVIPPGLQYVEVTTVIVNNSYDANTNTQNGEEDNTEKEPPDTVTLLVTPEQGKILVKLGANGKIHIPLVFHGTPGQSAASISIQEAVLLELYPPVEGEAEDSESDALKGRTGESGASRIEQTNITEGETAKTEGEIWGNETG